MVPFPVSSDPATASPTECLLHSWPHPDMGLADYWSAEFDGKLSCSHPGLDPMDGYVKVSFINMQRVSNKKKKMEMDTPHRYSPPPVLSSCSVHSTSLTREKKLHNFNLHGITLFDCLLLCVVQMCFHMVYGTHLTC